MPKTNARRKKQGAKRIQRTRRRGTLKFSSVTDCHAQAIANKNRKRRAARVERRTTPKGETPPRTRRTAWKWWR